MRKRGLSPKVSKLRIKGTDFKNLEEDI